MRSQLSRRAFVIVAAIAASPSSAGYQASAISNKPAAQSVPAEASKRWGLLAELAGTYWITPKRDHIDHYHWIVPGKTMGIDHFSPTGTRTQQRLSAGGDGLLTSQWPGQSPATLIVEADGAIKQIRQSGKGKAQEWRLERFPDGRIGYRYSFGGSPTETNYYVRISGPLALAEVRKWDRQVKVAIARFGGYAGAISGPLHGIDGSVKVPSARADPDRHLVWAGITFKFTSAAGGNYSAGKDLHGIFTVTGAELLIMPRNASQLGYSLRYRLMPNGAVTRFYDNGRGEAVDQVWLTKAGLGNADARRLAQDFQLVQERRAQQAAQAQAAAQYANSRRLDAEEARQYEYQRQLDEYQRCVRDERNRIIGSGMAGIVMGRPDVIAPAGTCVPPG